MAPISGEPANVQLAPWCQYTGARLKRYLQNGAVIWIPVLLSLKIENQILFSYDIYGFAINRIYTKTLQYVYLSFSVEVKVIEKLFFLDENKSRCE